MAEKITEIQALVHQASEAFHAKFGVLPLLATFAPGRVNLIGEHTDYNDGFVFPMALPLGTVVVGRKGDDPGKCRVVSLNVKLENDVEFSLPSTNKDLKASHPQWANYIKGVIANFHDNVTGFNAVVLSSVPLGGGLSSSASLEVASYTFLEALMGTDAKSSKQKALACQKAEHDFAGVPCGIMDQLISIEGQDGHALLIDCKSLEMTPVCLNEETTFIIINSNVRHELSGTEYSSRRSDCYEGARQMKKGSLREASLQDIIYCKEEMDEKLLMRVRHVVTEIDRTIRASEALCRRDYTTFGKLMVQSHYSLKNDYEVSCPELDELVDIAMSVPGVLGSRMTGGGFGGCTVTCVRKDRVEELIYSVKERYSGCATFYVCAPSGGARIIMK